MNLTRKLNLMMIVVCCMPQVIQASSDFFDHDDRTSVIRYVIEIEDKKSEIVNLWHSFFYKQEIVTGSYYYQGQLITTHKYITLRKMNTTDENVAEYNKAEIEYDLFIEAAIENIKFMVSNGADLNAQDEFGKTVIDYCSVEKVYNALRELGAPFSLKAWAYFHSAEAIIIGFIGTPVVVIGTMALVKYAVDLCK